MTAINIKAYTDDTSQIEVIKAVLSALKIKFEIGTSDKPYNPEFVEMIKKSDKEFADGKGTKMSVTEFKNLCK
jgi:hypothetical protein